LHRNQRRFAAMGAWESASDTEPLKDALLD
jgi:hypothetical protein